MVWTKNARAPDTAIHPLTQVKIPTGTDEAIRQKAYPIPHKYVQAMRAEIDGLLKAELIEPDRAKGATTDQDIKLKIAVDFRKLNSATESDTGSLVDQGDIFKTFHNRPNNSLCDVAGGYYQCKSHPEDKHKTCFVLPMSCGGTTFVRRIAPYGLTNMPAIYSLAMQYVCRVLQDHDLGYVNREGEEKIYVDRGCLGVGSIN
eukprot:6211753-Pleurochrysis_carterae.AAC.3